MSEQRTEQPTQRRREEARRKGQGVGRSHEFGMAVTLGVGLVALSAFLPGAASSLGDSLRAATMELGAGRPTDGQLLARAGQGLVASVVAVLPLALLVTGVGIGANLVSGGLIFSTHPLRFDFGRLNPMTGMKRLVDRQALLRLGISTAKLVLLGLASWFAFAGSAPRMLESAGSSLESIAGLALDAIFGLGITMTLLLAAVSVVDFIVQRRRALGQLRMTKDEVKRELHDQEGDPQQRAHRRRRARQLAFTRMMDAVPTADVVVTNPIHLAVALKYDALSMKAPKIVAKGQRLMAQRIKDLARESGVPIVEDVPLARALFPRALGAEVPPELYRAVARLLVLVHEARFGRRTKNVTESVMEAPR